MMTEELAEPKWKDLKDIFLAKKQGEALERITKPLTHEEQLGLGYYGPQTVLALKAIDLLELIVNDIAGLDPNNPINCPLHSFTGGIGIASGSREAKRMEKALETIGQLGQYFPMKKSNIPEPQHVDLNE